MATVDFSPVPRQSLGDGVFIELRDAILAGRIKAGEALPPERDLAVSFAVNRHAVREAVKRLQQAGFVHVVHGGGTRVLDVRRTAGLDLLAHLARSIDDSAGDLVRDGLEMRRCVGVEAARLAAARADNAARKRLLVAVSAYGDGGGEHPTEGAELTFWSEVVDASGNLAFRLALNSLLQAIDAQPDLMGELFAAERGDVGSHAELAAAIAAKDVDLAGELAYAILSQAVVALERISRRTRRESVRQA